MPTLKRILYFQKYLLSALRCFNQKCFGKSSQMYPFVSCHSHQLTLWHNIASAELLASHQSECLILLQKWSLATCKNYRTTAFGRPVRSARSSKKQRALASGSNHLINIFRSKPSSGMSLSRVFPSMYSIVRK